MDNHELTVYLRLTAADPQTAVTVTRDTLAAAGRVASAVTRPDTDGSTSFEAAAHLLVTAADVDAAIELASGAVTANEDMGLIGVRSGRRNLFAGLK